MKKKRYLLAVAAVVLGISITGCGKTVENADRDSQTAPGEEGTSENVPAEITPVEDVESTEYVSMGGAEGTETGLVEDAEGTEAASTEFMLMEGAEKGQYKATLYVSNENADNYKKETVYIESLTAENLIKALAEKKVLPKETKVIGFMDQEGALVLNLSKDYEVFVNKYGTAGEMMSVGGVVNTFLDAYGAEQITILVDGGAWESGHAEYKGPLGRFVLPEA